LQHTAKNASHNVKEHKEKRGTLNFTLKKRRRNKYNNYNKNRKRSRSAPLPRKKNQKRFTLMGGPWNCIAQHIDARGKREGKYYTY